MFFMLYGITSQNKLTGARYYLKLCSTETTKKHYIQLSYILQSTSQGRHAIKFIICFLMLTLKVLQNIAETLSATRNDVVG